MNNIGSILIQRHNVESKLNKCFMPAGLFVRVHVNEFGSVIKQLEKRASGKEGTNQKNENSRLG